MKHLKSSIADLHELFERISVKHIAEELKCFDSNRPASEAKREMEHNDFDVMGLTEKGKVTGYIEQSALRAGSCGSYKTPFDSIEINKYETPLIEFLRSAQNNEWRRSFAARNDGRFFIITKGDLQKIPVRLFLFAHISLLEMNFRKIIKSEYRDEGWREKIKCERLYQAECQHKSLKRKGANLDLTDCLQFCDLRTILNQSPALDRVWPRRIGFDELLHQAESLRNNLAHSQDLTNDFDGKWPKVISLIDAIETMLDNCQNYPN